MSYQDRCCVGVNVDTGAVPDPDALVDCLQEGFEEVLALAGAEHDVRRPTRLAATSTGRGDPPTP